jgi:hypothetical protein
MTLFANDITYRLLDVDGPGVEVQGFQVGMMAVARDSRFMLDEDGAPPVDGFFVDHWPTGSCIYWCDTFAKALEVADAVALVVNDATTRELAEQRVLACDLPSWMFCESEHRARFVRYMREGVLVHVDGAS